MRQHHLPPGIEVQAYEAICALASCDGLDPVHLQTIRYCIAVCPEGFERSYIAYFEELTAADHGRHKVNVPRMQSTTAPPTHTVPSTC
jgi:hypothetical protein